MIHLRIQMIRSSGQYHRLLAVFPGVFQRVFSCLLYIVFHLLIFGPGSFHRLSQFRPGDAGTLQHLIKLSDQEIIVIVRQERMSEDNLIILEYIIHIASYHFRICGDDRTIIVIRRILILSSLVIDAWIEYPLGAMVHQPLDMPVHQLGRITRCIGGNSLHTLFIHVLAGYRRQLDAESQLGKHSEPERIVLIHIEDSRDAYYTSPGLFLCERLVLEKPFQLILIEIRQLIHFLRRFSFSTLASVAHEELAAIAELVYSHQTVVLTLAAPDMTYGHIEGRYIVRSNDRRLRSLHVIFSGYQSRSVRAHQSRDIRPYYLLSQDILNGSENIEEGTALYHDLVSRLFRIPQLDNFIEGILYYRIREPRGNISDSGAFLLRLLDLGIHEHCASRPQIHRSISKQRRLSERLGIHVYRLGVRFNKGATSRRACLVEHDIIDSPIFYPHALHVLTAYIQDKIHARQKFFRSLIMSHGLYLAQISLESCLYQPFPIARRCHIGYMSLRRKERIKLLEHVHSSIQRFSLIACIVGVKQILVLVDESRFSGSGSRIYTQEHLALGLPYIFSLYPVSLVSFSEMSVVIFVSKEWIHMLGI